MRQCLIYGTGGHAGTLAQVLLLNGWSIAAYFDDKAQEGEFLKDVPVTKYDIHFNGLLPLFIGVGNNNIRKKLARKVLHGFGVISDPSAIISNDVVMEAGTVVLAGAIIQTGVTIGRHCIINIGCAIDHDVIIGDFVHISPKVYIGGGAYIGEGATIGPGAIVMRNAQVPDWADIPPNSVIT